MKSFMRDEYKYISAIYNANRNTIRNLREFLFVLIKNISIPAFANRQGAVIYRYADMHKKGYITAYIDDGVSNFYCDIVDEYNNIYNVSVSSKKPFMTLEQFCTILAGIKTMNHEEVL